MNTDILNIKIRDDLWLKPEYLNHKIISGNKLRKLKLNIAKSKTMGYHSLLTFGGAFSNHIAAVAQVGKDYGFNTIGIIRGEELRFKINENPTLKFAASCGMRLNFVSRESFRDKSSEAFLQKLKDEFGPFYHLPEGGTNDLAVKGCEEILTAKDANFDYICCPVGTGGTIAGLINSSKPHQKILGFPALKGDFLKTDIAKFAKKNNWILVNDYHFGGYAKINMELISFINRFKAEYNIQLDPIYTAKMMYGVLDMIHNEKFPSDARILAIHTGGLQGIQGMNMRLQEMNLPLIQ
ncbi:MAG: pyridoxal-phosphate dependent enzyme [Bacteroidia bacterium]|nr:pyridoxal-phosphate dependent enzyme [Bacteroidia bacterium]